MTSDELDALLLAWLNGHLDTDGLRQVNDIVEKQPHAAQRLVELADEELLFQNGIRELDQKDPSKVYSVTSGAEPAESRVESIRRRKISPFQIAAAAAVLAVAVMIFLAFRTNTGSSEAAVAVIDDGQGTAIRKDHALVCTRDFKLQANDRIVTPKDRSLRFHYADGSTVDVNSDSELALLDEGGAKHVTLTRGALFVKAAKQPVGLPWVIHTAAADATIVGTAFEILMIDDTCTLRVAEGNVRFGNKLREVAVPGGRASSASTGQAPVAPASIAQNEIAPWLTGAVTAKPAQRGNLLENPGFENGETGWQVYNPNGDSINRAIVSAPVHFGEKSLQITFDTSETGMMQEVAVTENEKYSACGWIKLNALSERCDANIIILWRNKKGEMVKPANGRQATVGTVRGTANWTRVTGEFIAPPTAERAYFLVHPGKNANSSGVVWFDDLEFMHVDK